MIPNIITIIPHTTFTIFSYFVKACPISPVKIPNIQNIIVNPKTNAIDLINALFSLLFSLSLPAKYDI